MAPATQTDRVRDLFISSIRALAEALEAKDPYTAGHSRRVTDLSVQICGQIGLERSAVAQVRLAAMLHDIGKIGVRESVLNKEGPLTPEEYEHIMQHMNIGKRILAPIFEGKAILDIVTYHHERWDGKGLPEGLKGEKIPLGARIVALADAVDAMGSMRPYRAGKAPGEIAAEVEKGAGSQFDPNIVKAFFATKQGRQMLAARSGKEKGAPAGAPETTGVKTPPTDTAQRAVSQAPLSARSRHRPESPADAPESEKPETPPEEGEVPKNAASDSEGAKPVLSAEAPPDKPLFSRGRVFKDARQIKEIKALPFVTAEVLSLTSTVESDVDTLINTIMRDQALVAKILNLANTSLYASRGRVQSLERAVVNIGYSGIREITLGIAVADIFSKRKSAGSLDRLVLWRHQLACAALGRALAAAGDTAPPEEVFVAGLLHDLGISVLDDLYPEEYAVCAEYARVTGRPLLEAEEAYIGADHTAVGAQVAGEWNLPEKLATVMQLHHESWASLDEDAGPDCATVMHVKLAETMARACGVGSDCDPVLEDVPNSVFKRLDLDAKKIARVLSDFPTEMTELEMVFFMNSQGDAGIANSEPEGDFAGRKALFVEAVQKPFDPVARFLQTLGVETFSAPSVAEGVDARKPDLVLMRHTSDRAVENSLRQLGELARKGVVGAVKVFILGGYAGDGRLASLYPANCTAVLKPPFSIPNVTRNLELFFADAPTSQRKNG